MNKYQTLANNTIILAIGQFGSKMLVYVMLKFYTNMLGADGFGDVNNIINASSLLISVVTLSINEGVLRYALDKANNGKHVLSIGINTAIIGLVIFAAAVPLVGLIEMLSGYQWLIYMYVATGSIKGICAIYVRARGHVKLFAVDGILTTLAVILLNLLLLGVFNLGVVGYVLSVSLGDLISIIFLTLKAKLYKQYRPLGNDPALAKAMLRYSIPLMPTTVMWWIINVSDTFMVTAIHGSAANGVYSFAFKFPNLAAIVVGIFSQAWHMSAITERNSRKISQFYSNVFSMIQTVMYIAASGILLVLRPIIMPFFGSEGFEGAYMYVPFLISAVIFQSFNNFLSSIYEACNKTTHSFISSVIGAVSNVVLNLILLNSPMGVLGAALATLVSYALVYIYRAIDTKKYLYMKVNYPKMFINLLLIGIMSAAIMLLDSGVILNVINCVVFVVICAINFKSAAQAVKLFISRRSGGSDSSASE
ncbi:MAG: oligosaccharide flippase family protein [Oscillospiraceae bacterium]|nr:oligosaccharide flippase family protein [Oscillospiraceae bacterium]